MINVVGICLYVWSYSVYMTHIYSGITRGRVLNGELYTQIFTEVNLSVFVYKMFREAFTSALKSGMKASQNSM